MEKVLGLAIPLVGQGLFTQDGNIETIIGV